MSREQNRANLTDVVTKLKRFLPDYLTSQGVHHSDEKFTCFAHPGDSTPSMQFVSGSSKQAVICYGCDYKGDIFRSAHHFERMPIEGREWVTQTVSTLCRRFGVDMASLEVSDEDLRRIRLRQLCNHVHELLQEVGQTTLAQERGLSQETAREWGLLAVPDLPAFMEKLIKAGGYTEALLRDLGYGYKDRSGQWTSHLFGPRIMTVTLKSSGGYVVGFTGRNVDWKKGDSFPKYKDVKKNEVFDKTTILYGYDKALKSRPSFVYAFEGYLDVSLAHQSGVTNTVGTMGTHFSASQISLLQQASIHHLVLCFDRDPNDAGWKAMDRLIADTFQGYESLRVEIVELPDPFHDPDDFLKANGGEAFKALPRKTAFRWRMERRNASGTQIDSDFIQEMVQLIAMEPSPIFRSDMERELSDFCGRPLKEIKDSIKAILDRKEASFTTAVENLKIQTSQRLKNSHGSTALNEIRSSAAAADQLEKTYLEGETDTSAATIEIIDKMILADQSQRPAIVWKTGIAHYDEIYDGIPKQDIMIGLLGNPSAGKSSLCTYLGKQLVQGNPDMALLFHTTDDPKPQVIRKIVAALSGVQEVKIRRGTLSKDEKDRVAASATVVKEWIGEHRVEIRDASDGYEVIYAERWIKQFRDRHPDRPVLYILDNLYKTDMDYGDNPRGKVESNANRIQLLCQIEHITALCTLEPRKTGDRPRLKLEDIKETKKVRQNVHIGWILHNGAPSDGSASEFITSERTWKGQRGERPMVELQVAKHKDMPSGSIFFEFEYDDYTFRAKEFTNQMEMMRKVSESSQSQEKGGGYGDRWKGGESTGRLRPGYFKEAPEGEEINDDHAVGGG